MGRRSLPVGGRYIKSDERCIVKGHIVVDQSSITAGPYKVVTTRVYDSDKHDRLNMDEVNFNAGVEFWVYSDNGETVGEVLDLSKHKVMPVLQDEFLGTEEPPDGARVMYDDERCVVLGHVVKMKKYLPEDEKVSSAAIGCFASGPDCIGLESDSGGDGQHKAGTYVEEDAIDDDKNALPDEVPQEDYKIYFIFRGGMFQVKSFQKFLVDTIIPCATKKGHEFKCRYEVEDRPNNNRAIVIHKPVADNASKYKKVTMKKNKDVFQHFKDVENFDVRRFCYREDDEEYSESIGHHLMQGNGQQVRPLAEVPSLKIA